MHFACCFDNARRKPPAQYGLRVTGLTQLSRPSTERMAVRIPTMAPPPVQPSHCSTRTLVARFLMRFNLITQTSPAGSRNTGPLALSLTLRPSCGAQGNYSFPTDSTHLLRLLEAGTDLPQAVLRRFMGDVYSRATAVLHGVELKDETLQSIGFFVD